MDTACLPIAIPINATPAAADLADGRHDLRLDQGGADDLVPRHVSDNADQAGDQLDRTRPPTRRHADDGLEIKTKLAEVMRIAGETDRLDGRIEMDDAYLGGQRSGGKTGRGSPGKKPIVVAVQTSDDGRLSRIKLRRIARFKGKRVKSIAKKIIAEGATVVTDGRFTPDTRPGAPAAALREPPKTSTN